MVDLVLARFHGFDPSCAPALRRMSDGGLLPRHWIIVVVTCAPGAALIAARWNRAGAAAIGAVCRLAFGAAFLSGLGH